MLDKIRRLTSGRFGRNVAWMSGATIAGHGLFLLASPILTRLFSLQDFATLGILMTVQALLLAVMSARIEWSVPTAKNQMRSAALVSASFIMLSVTFLLLITVLFIWSDVVLGWLGLGLDDRDILMVFLLSILTTGIQMILHSWCVSEARLMPIAVSKLFQSVVFVGVTLIAGYVSGLGIWLAVGFALSNVLAAALLLFLVLERLRILLRFKLRYILNVSLQIWREIAASFGSSFLHSLAFYMPFLMIWFWYDETALGWFAFVFRIGTAPVTFLSHAIAKSFRAEAADLVRTDPVRLRRLFLRTLRALTLVAIPFMVVCLCGPVYFEVVFGVQWSGAGIMLAVLSPMLVSLLIFSSTNHLIVYRKQHWQLWSDALSLVAFSGSFVTLASMGHSVFVTLGISSSAFFVSYGLRTYLHLRANHLWTKAI